MEATMRPTTAHDDNIFDLNSLLHPGTAFEHPQEVVSHPGLSLAEKRAILASWASDASAIASCSSLRAPEGLKAPVSIDDILGTGRVRLVYRVLDRKMILRRLRMARGTRATTLIIAGEQVEVTHQSVPIASLKLNPDNPRIRFLLKRGGGANDQKNILALVKEQPERPAGRRKVYRGRGSERARITLRISARRARQ
jgi:hypothetical protein